MKPDINKLYRQIRDRISRETLVIDYEDDTMGYSGYFEFRTNTIYIHWTRAFTEQGLHVLLHEYRHYQIFKRFSFIQLGNAHYWTYPEKHETDADDYAAREMRRMGFGRLNSWLCEHNKESKRRLRLWGQYYGKGGFNVDREDFARICSASIFLDFV